MKRMLIAAGTLALTAAACSNGTGTTTPTLSAVISSASTLANQAVCDARSKAMQVVSQVQSGAASSQAAVVSALGEVKTSLQTHASTLDSQGQSTLANGIRMLADEVGQLMVAVQGQNTSDIVSASAKVVSAISALPACQSP